MRESGILLPVFSLPGSYGIGGFSCEAKRFIDFLKEAGQNYWQVLPVGPTGYGDSPYQSFSTFAGNPYFIDLEQLTAAGLLTMAECEEADCGEKPGLIDYGALYSKRIPLLRKAYKRSSYASTREFKDYQEHNALWLEDYALYMALKDHFGGKGLFEWPENVRIRNAGVIESYRDMLKDDVLFYEFLQYEFSREWKKLKSYANARGISIIGDIPIYVASDSADFWSKREMFQVDKKGNPTNVAACPPDGFSATGQLWGNPLYDWDYHKKTGYEWWLKRIEKCAEFFDVVRIDHFRGFDEYFSVRAGAPDATSGQWKKGPGMDLFRAVRTHMGDVRIIAEDLGYMTDSVRKLVADTGYPNMKVLEFAFDSRDSTGAYEYLPYHYGRNCVVYTGTHDNETLVGWLSSILPKEKQMLKDYLDTDTDDPKILTDKIIKLAQASTADLAVIPMQDYLGLDNSARINKPSTFGTNWRWRMDESVLTENLALRIRKVTKTYGRLNVTM